MENNNLQEAAFYLNKVWLQCENKHCLKWRILSKQDAKQYDLNKPWFCHLNSDTSFNNCSVPEENVPEESYLCKIGLRFVYSHTMGSLVVVNLRGWPSWPAILCPNPVTGEETCYVNYYHVEYLGKPHTRGFVSVESIKPYCTSFQQETQKTPTKWYESALAEAKEIANLTCEQRIEICHATKKCFEKLHRPKRKYIRRKFRKENNSREKLLSCFKISEPDDFSLENSVTSEPESILKDLEKVLNEVTQPFCKTNLLEEKQEKMKNKHDLEDCSQDDCIIIDGIEFKTGECIDAVTNNLKQIDCLMSEFPNM